MKQVQIAGMSWYRREQYARVMEVMEDKDTLFASFDDWLAAAEKTEQRIKAMGITAVRAYIDPDEFVGWCRSRGLNVDAKARNQYANTVAAASYQQGTG